MGFDRLHRFFHDFVSEVMLEKIIVFDYELTERYELSLELDYGGWEKIPSEDNAYLWSKPG